MNTQEFDAIIKLWHNANLMGDTPILSTFIKKAEGQVLTMAEVTALKNEEIAFYADNFQRTNYRPEAGNVDSFLNDLSKFYDMAMRTEELDAIIKLKKDLINEIGGDVENYPSYGDQCPAIVHDGNKADVQPPTEVIASLPKPPGIDLFRNSYGLPRNLHIHRGAHVIDLKTWAKEFATILNEVHGKIQALSACSTLSDRNFELAKKWELEKFNDASMANSGVHPLSYSLVNPDIHRQLRENVVDEQVDAYMRGLHEKRKMKDPLAIDKSASKIGMKLNRATGCTIYSRIKHGEWNTAATALTGILGHGFLTGQWSVDFVKKYHPWGAYYPLALEGQRFSASDLSQFNCTSKNGHPFYQFSLCFIESKCRMIGNIPKELQVVNRAPAKWMAASLVATETYATSKEVASKKISSWESSKLFLFAFDLKNMDKAYTMNHNAFATSCYPFKEYQEWLWLENGVNTLTSSSRGLDSFDVVNTAHKIKASGENDTGYGNSNVNLREYLKAVKYSKGYDYKTRCPEEILDVAMTRILVMGDDVIAASESAEQKDAMFEYFEKYSNWKVLYTEIPVFLAVFFAEGITFNSVIRCINNHFEGEHAKEHPLILTMSLGSHYALLKDSPFFEIWREAVNKFLEKYPLYCLCGTVEQCGEFINSDECKYLMIEYSTSGQKAADDIRSMLRGFVYSFAPDENLTNRDFFLDLLFSLEANQPEMTIDVLKGTYYSKDIERLLIDSFENPFTNGFEAGRQTITRRLADLNLFTIDNKSKKILENLKRGDQQKDSSYEYED